MVVIIGWFFVLLGVVDLVGSYSGYDVWGDWIGVVLPEFIWRWTAWLELGLGWFLIKAGAGSPGDHSK